MVQNAELDLFFEAFERTEGIDEEVRTLVFQKQAQWNGLKKEIQIGRKDKEYISQKKADITFVLLELLNGL